MKLLADECVNSSTVAILRRSVPDTVHLSDLGLTGISNGQVIDVCVREGRVLFTLNYRHFSDRRIHAIGSNPGIIAVRVTNTDWRVVDPVVSKFMNEVDLGELPGKLTVVRRTGYTIIASDGSAITRLLPRD